MRSWWTSSWLILPQAVISAPPWGRMPRCPSLGSGTWQVSSCNHTKAWGQSGPLETLAVSSLTTSFMEQTLAWQGFTHMVNRPYLLSPVASYSASIKRKAMSWQIFYFSPQTMRMVREDSSAGVIEGMWNCCIEGQMVRLPHSKAISFPHLSNPWEEKAKSVMARCL